DLSLTEAIEFLSEFQYNTPKTVLEDTRFILSYHEKVGKRDVAITAKLLYIEQKLILQTMGGVGSRVFFFSLASYRAACGFVSQQKYLAQQLSQRVIDHNLLKTGQMNTTRPHFQLASSYSSSMVPNGYSVGSSHIFVPPPIPTSSTTHTTVAATFSQASINNSTPLPNSQNASHDLAASQINSIVENSAIMPVIPNRIVNANNHLPAPSGSSRSTISVETHPEPTSSRSQDQTAKPKSKA
ncbi:hypothetical protein HDU76_009054, partial [Blyttiomyces sp. JEL0837]